MELQKLEYYDSIYRLRSFTKAANEHFISQPSLSNAIKSLEEEFGFSLINRNTKPLSFTVEGERFYLHVRQILNDVRMAKLDMQSLHESKEEVIRLVWPSCFIHDYLLPTLYTDFHNLYPNYQIACTESTIDDTMKDLLSDRLDIAYVHIPDNYDTNQFDFVPIICCEMCALVSKDNPLANMESLTFQQLADQNIYAFQKGSLYRRKLKEAFDRHHLDPKITCLNQMTIIKKLVSQNYGVSFVTIDDSETLTAIDDVLIIPLAEPISFVKGFLVKKGNTSLPAIHNLISYVQAVIQRMRFEQEN